MMNMKPVESSNIAEIGYDNEHNVLHVAFHTGSVYAYEDVPYQMYEDMLNAPSVGKYFNENVRDMFVTTKL